MRFLYSAFYTFLAALLICAESTAAELDLSSLAELEVGERLTLPSVPIGSERLARVEFERIQLYADDAAVRVIRDGAEEFLDRSNRVFLMGRSASDADIRVALLGTRGDSDSWTGGVYGPDGFESLRVYREAAGWRMRAYDAETLVPDGVDLAPSCSNDEHAETRGMGTLAMPAGIAPGPRGGNLRLGTLAIDTDKEWLALRFGDNTSNAAAYNEALMMSVNGLFEAQLNLRMQIGDVFLRVGSDPYPNATSGAGGAELNEFGTYWQNTYNGIDRSHAAMISGRSSSGNSASGIAWVNSYCEYQNTGGSYSYSQLFRNPGFPASVSAGLFAHELGHNLGSPHTHCYNPPIDQCYAVESGCYSGPTSCPTAGVGTLMSYCHLGACSSSNIQLNLASRVITQIDQRINANTPSCLSEGGGVIFADRFED